VFSWRGEPAPRDTESRRGCGCKLRAGEDESAKCRVSSAKCLDPDPGSKHLALST